MPYYYRLLYGAIGYAGRLEELLKSCGIASSIYAGVKSDPTLVQVKEGALEFLSCNCDTIVSLGGGSAHDCAKGVKLTIIKGNIGEQKAITFAAVNTTAGTASEVTRFAIIKDEEKHYKLSLIDNIMIPDIAVDDPELMKDMPPSLTAATGMDALTHAVEALVAKERNYLTDCTALKAMELIAGNIEMAYKDGSNMPAREAMAYAQYMAGMAFSNAGLGLVHAMAHQLGGLYGLPHGLCNAVLLPFVINFNSALVYKAYASAARAMNACEAAIPEKTAARIFVRYLRELNKKLGIPSSLKELNVLYEDCEKLAKMAMEDPSIKSNPVETNESQVLKIYQDAFVGRLQN